MQVSIRAYQPRDLARMKEITLEAFDGVSIDCNIQAQAGSINGRDWKWRKARHIDQDVARDPAGAFVAEVDGCVVGYITTWHDAEEGIGYVPNLAVSGQFRRQGLARQLIQHALHHFRQLDLSYVRIETLEQNPIGQQLYPSCGFHEVARQIHYGMPLNKSPKS